MARKEDQNVGREMGEGYKYVSLGLTFAGGIIFFLAVGFGLDRLLGTTPVFILIGTFLGTVLSFLSVYRKLQEEERQRREQKKK
jgi:F0F1-type ATP synthase assembly protein I